ncbi:MAG: 1-acyl-sn-glycerol-3-phosphate acyltransferase, partial [bacterium]
DIPIAFWSVVGGYSRMITRERYRRGLPLISHMVRLYDHPTVRPGERMATEIHRLRELAKTSDRPIVIFPEGRRSHDGEIGRFRTAGLKTLLSARTWKVYAIVVDGLWRTTSVGDFVENVKSMRVKSEDLGPFDFNHETDDADQFVADLERRMRSKLEAMRHPTHNLETEARKG